ncbi:hypothetical protein NQT63_02110 [Pseudoalteromonas agarivorans]|uniref:hypothetical protein n=1 Tax=Pseudoalteromonas agarivorans TaxID=176102 RepID=UPI0021195373|nr:hypothetical protein [Pseudoalteromonas agarivorans]MCP3702473.1 hypothetical protein [Alteromonas sp.]MCQ8884487.1 hypothetical protein [Pseudoalteromonas agarivorans]
MDDKPVKLKMTQEQHIYGWMIKQGLIKTFDLSWPCLALEGLIAKPADFAAHSEVTAIFRRMGVR